MIYNIVLDLGAQLHDSVTHINISLFLRFTDFFFHIGYHRLLSRVPCGKQ